MINLGRRATFAIAKPFCFKYLRSVEKIWVTQKVGKKIDRPQNVGQKIQRAKKGSQKIVRLQKGR